MSLARLAGRIDTMEEYLHSVEHRLDASFVAFSTQILQSDRETRDAVLTIARRESAQLERNLRSEMQTVRGETRTLRGETEKLREEMERLREEMYTLHGIAMRRMDRLEKALVDGLADTHRFMRVLHEEVLSRLALLAEGRTPLN